MNKLFHSKGSTCSSNICPANHTNKASNAGMSRLLYEFVLYVMKNPIVQDTLLFQPENYLLKLCETLQKNRNHKLISGTTATAEIKGNPVLKDY
ncbi:hypothetical protein T03_14556 [Trichinella britovi]|uniref:Uncharacterized protein n=1 Tax=Trichinella britovi TaxID=45882 RepID=A0A0V1AKK9_TRIBR|nr:hypothetical protein T03_14556 [Trichinella britovi]